MAPQHLAKQPRRWPRRLLIGLNIFIAICLVAVGSAYGYLRWRYGQIPKIEIGKHLRLGGDDDPGAPMNVLLVGSDTRKNLTKAEQAKFGTEADVGKPHSDTMMILHVDPRAKKASILSIPRDLYVTIAGGGRDRINTAIGVADSAGVGRLIDTIRQELGIEIDHYAAVDFRGFRSIVQTVGGVVVPFPAPARDILAGLKITQAGCVELTGEQALAYVRSRHFESHETGKWRTDPTGDLGRIQRQQDFIRRMIGKAISLRVLVDPIKLNRLVDAGIKNVTIDSKFSTSDMKRIGTRFQTLDPDEVEMLTLPTVDARVGEAAVLKLKQPEAKQLIDQFNGVTPSPSQHAALPSVLPGTVRVRVLNGSGVGGQAAKTAGELERARFNVADTGAARNYNFAVTEIHYAPGQRSKAALLQAYVDGGAPKVVQDSSLVGVDLVLITGRDMVGIKSPPDRPGVTTTTRPGTTTTAKSPKPGAPALPC